MSVGGRMYTTRVGRRVTGAALAVSLMALGVGDRAEAATYWISPWLTKNVSNYYLSDCSMSASRSEGRAFETGGDVSGKIGIRAQNISGDTEPIWWDDDRVSSTLVPEKYKLYHY